MSKNEMISMIEQMNNFDELAAKAKAKADAIREAIKEEMMAQEVEEMTAGAWGISAVYNWSMTPTRKATAC